jgi:hypothetical protein
VGSTLKLLIYKDFHDPEGTECIDDRLVTRSTGAD